MRISERPYLISIALLALVVAWMVVPTGEEDAEDAVEQARAAPLQKVSYRVSEPESTQITLRFTGQTKADKIARLSAEIDGTLLAFDVPRGSAVKAGDLIARLSTGSIEATIRSAQADRQRAQSEYNAQYKLKQQGLTSASKESAALAVLEAARARVDEVERQLSKSRLTAPFDGVVADHHADAGDFVRTGTPLATLISLDPIRAVGDVTERDVMSLSVGDSATLRLLNDTTLPATISFVSPSADPNTRTFSIEVIAEPGESTGAIAAGLTTEIAVVLDTIEAYKISPALLTLSADGDIQVATVDDDNRARLNTVEILRSERDGVWIKGLPPSARIITLGQGFVDDGDLVDASPEASPERAVPETDNS